MNEHCSYSEPTTGPTEKISLVTLIIEDGVIRVCYKSLDDKEIAEIAKDFET